MAGVLRLDSPLTVHSYPSEVDGDLHRWVGEVEGQYVGEASDYGR